MFHLILEMLIDKNGKPSIGRFGFFLTVGTTVLWTNVIFALYFWNAIHGNPTPDMPSQLVMLIVTLLGGYIGAKVPEAFSGFNGHAVDRSHDIELPGNLTGLAIKEEESHAQSKCRPGCLICKKSG